MTHMETPHTDQLAPVLSDLQAAKDALALKRKSLDKTANCLANGWKRLSKGRKPLTALRELIANIQEIGADPSGPDLKALADSLSRHLERITDQAKRRFQSDLRAAAAEAGLDVGQVAHSLTVGPFALLVESTSESASLEYAKVPAAVGLALSPRDLVASIVGLKGTLLEKPSDLAGLSGEVQEAIRVTLARQGRPTTSADLRAELPAVFREMAYIRQSKRPRGSKSSQEFTLPRFIVEIASLVKSDQNVSSPQSFRLETAVIENTGNPRKSVFIPNDLSRGYGEGTYFQAIVFRRGV